MAVKKGKAKAKKAPPPKKAVSKPAPKKVAKPTTKPATGGKASKASTAPGARDTARLLLEIEAVHCRADKPFIFTSGRASPVYIDCRKIISLPEARAPGNEMILRQSM